MNSSTIQQEATKTIVRPSTEADCQSIQHIYGYHVEHGTGSFDEQMPSFDEVISRRVHALDAGLPHLVIEIDERVVGFAQSSPLRTRSAYRFSVESSVYVAPGNERRGFGTLLMRQVIQETRKAGRKQMIAAIGDSDNHASIRLHEALGFEHVGTYRSVGFKHGHWLDVVLMQLAL